MGLELLLGVATYWNQHLLSDIDVSLEVASSLDQTATSAKAEAKGDVGMEHPKPCVLKKIPAHKIVLCSSPYFKAQILRWLESTTTLTPDLDGTVADSSSSSSQSVSQKPVLSVVLQHRSQASAAIAVLAALYGISKAHMLSQEQLLQAAVLADMWQIPDVATAAVGLLVDQAKGSGLSEAAAKAFLDLEAVPNCLLPLFSAVVSSGVGGDKPVVTLKPWLLRVLGNLEDVWADAALRDILLKLPLPAMEVLLGCDELQVAFEDTVLFTAQKYLDAINDRQHWQAAEQQLAPLIRCPHLSSFWLSALAVSVDAPRVLLLSKQRAHLCQMLMLLQAEPTFELTAPELERLLPGAPSSWGLPKRICREVSNVQLTWRVDVEAIRAIARSSASQQSVFKLSSDCVTPPLGGVVFGAEIALQWDAAKQGSLVGLYAGPTVVPTDA